MNFRRKVKSGSQTGSKIGFPTINLNVGNFSQKHSPGVYSCTVIVDTVVHNGALYFGPKLSGKSNTLEVFILDFKKDVYGQYITVQVGNRIRGPKKFSNLNELKKQIEKDLKYVV